jgi:hypothetical protein
MGVWNVPDLRQIKCKVSLEHLDESENKKISKV